jgi:hypothetical protein
MKKVLLLTTLIISCHLFAKQKNDTIISASKGTIICKIKTVENENIYYYVGDVCKFISLSDVSYYSGHGKVNHNFDSKHTPQWQYKPDSNKYTELVCIPHLSIAGVLLAGEVNPAQRFFIYVNANSDSATNKSLTPFIYPIDALNFFAKKGFDLKYIYSVYEGTSKDLEIRHYILEKN